MGMIGSTLRATKRLALLALVLWVIVRVTGADASQAESPDYLETSSTTTRTVHDITEVGGQAAGALGEGAVTAAVALPDVLEGAATAAEALAGAAGYAADGARKAADGLRAVGTFVDRVGTAADHTFGSD